MNGHPVNKRDVGRAKTDVAKIEGGISCDESRNPKASHAGGAKRRKRRARALHKVCVVDEFTRVVFIEAPQPTAKKLLSA